MGSTFGILQLALKSLQSQQAALETTGHNIANANSAGYTRQSVLLDATPSDDVAARGRLAGPGMYGSGVQVQAYQRIRDAFTDTQWRQQTARQGQYQSASDVLSQIESGVNEPSDSGLSTQLDSFFNAWQDVSIDPENTAARQSLTEGAASMAAIFHDTRASLTDLATNLGTQQTGDINTINTIATQIAALNTSIKNATVAGLQPNDLLDSRDNLLDQLATYGDYTISTDSLGQDTVTLAGKNIVDPTVAGGTTPLAASDITASLPTTGKLRSTYDMINTTIPGYVSDLDTIAGALITSVNAVQTAGFDLNGTAGVAFFTGTDASNINVSAALLGNPDLVAASSSATAAGNGDNALAAADLRDQALIGSSTISGSYQSFISDLGVQSQNAQHQLANAQSLVQNLSARRQEVSGVSLDEEMTNMLQYQHAYSAAARVLSTMNTMLDDLINTVA